MQSFSARSGSVYILGARFPTFVFGVACTILACSILGAVLSRNGPVPLLELVFFAPALVVKGQVWRLFTWPFFETGLLALVFSILIVLFFGRDLFYAWGARRFLGVLLLTPALAALVTTLLAPVLWAEVLVTPYLGTAVLMDILVVSWATLFPARQVLLYFVLPVGGRVLVYLTIGVTLLVGLLNGLHFVVPHFIALALILLYLRGAPFQRLGAWFRRPKNGPARRPSHLRPVERGEPPRWLH